MRTLVILASLGVLSALLASECACSNSRGADARAADAQAQPVSPAPKQSDADIKLAAQIRTAILQDSRVAGASAGITILVRGGMVTLQGRVKDQEQKQAAEAVAKSVPGVEKVENLLVFPGG
jgi:osmotically-inducible protein OsmY